MNERKPPEPALLPCLVTWPTEQTAGDLMADYVRPQHHCMLGAGHVHDFDPSAARVTPHRCHCGSWQPVRDTAR